MLLVISPAKTLDYETPVKIAAHSVPDYLDHARLLVERARRYSEVDLMEVMDVSVKIAALNLERFQSWCTPFTTDNARQALLAFKGDVYGGLAADSLSSADFEFAQGHLRILSGLYGLLRPLDLMQPYRLEMGTALKVGRPDNLYQYWGKTIAPYLNERLQGHAEPVVVNLASQEYFKSVNTKLLNAEVVECVFEDFKNGEYKVLSFFAKKARGMMARFALTQRLESIDQLKRFSDGGYAFAKAASSATRLVFRRKIDCAIA